jgi:hypothetical protein
MGYRATVITQERKYGSNTFCDWDMFTNKFLPAFAEAGFDMCGNDAQDFFEVERDHLNKFVDSLPDNDEVSIYPDYTNKELKQELTTAINETPGDWVSWEWF